MSHSPPFLHLHGISQLRPYHPGEHSAETTETTASVPNETRTRSKRPGKIHRVDSYSHFIREEADSSAGSGFVPGWRSRRVSDPLCSTELLQSTHLGANQLQQRAKGMRLAHLRPIHELIVSGATHISQITQAPASPAQVPLPSRQRRLRCRTAALRLWLFGRNRRKSQKAL